MTCGTGPAGDIVVVVLVLVLVLVTYPRRFTLNLWLSNIILGDEFVVVVLRELRFAVVVAVVAVPAVFGLARFVLDLIHLQHPYRLL